MNALGISVSYETVIDTVDSMRKGLDDDLQKWKTVRAIVYTDDACLNLMLIPINLQGVEIFLVDMRKSSASSQGNAVHPSHLDKIDFPEGLTPLGQVIQEGAVGGQYFRASAGSQLKLKPISSHYYSVTFSFDNLNKHVVPRHYSSSTGTVVMNMTSAFATFSRIPISWKELTTPPQAAKFASLPLQTWLPSERDFKIIKYDMRREVRKIIVKHVTIFQKLSSSVELFTAHKNTPESSQPSRFVSVLLHSSGI